MLTGKESRLLTAILSVVGGDGGKLIEEDKLYRLIKGKKFSYDDFNSALNSLTAEGYIDLIRCARGEDKLLFISPKIKSKKFAKEKKQFAENLLLKVLIAIIGSVTAFLVTQILYGIF